MLTGREVGIGKQGGRSEEKRGGEPGREGDQVRQEGRQEKGRDDIAG